jgi:hypothetical protein
MLVWTESCIPVVKNATLDDTYKECCSARFTFTLIGTIPPGDNNSTYYPNRCTGSPTTTNYVEIGPMVVDMEIVADEILVDDELLVNGEPFEAGRYLVNLGEGDTGTGTNFDGGLSECNGQHRIEKGKVIATVPQGLSVTLAGGDNHGIDLFVAGKKIVTEGTAIFTPASIILKPVSTP